MSEDMNVFDDSRITAIGLLVEAYTGLSVRFAAQVEAHGLSAVEFEVLMRLGRSPGHQLRMTDLATQTTLSTSGVTRVVDRMERDGLLARRACPSDRRSSYAVLTSAGMRRLHETLPGHLELIEQWFTGQLDPAALRGLLDALRTVRDAVHPGAVAGSVAGPDPAYAKEPDPAQDAAEPDPAQDAAEAVSPTR